MPGQSRGRRRLIRTACCLIPWCVLTACVSLPPDTGGTGALDESLLPPPDLELVIAGFGTCSDPTDAHLRLKRGEPVNVLVHGCYASTGRFRALAQVFARQGQQAICYRYDDRRSLPAVAGELRRGLDRLVSLSESPQLTLIGHSQGGLIARHALREDLPEARALSDGRQRLVTISSPFAGIAAADHCASTTARVISLGLVVPICWAISGEKWYEITRASDFMREPGRLQSSVSRHLLVLTDERDSCRRREAGRCLEDDFVFTLEEQTPPPQAIDPRVVRQTLNAGHAEVVGNGQEVPEQLIDLLVASDILSLPAVTEEEGRRAFLARLFTSRTRTGPDANP